MGTQKPLRPWRLCVPMQPEVVGEVPVFRLKTLYALGVCAFASFAPSAEPDSRPALLRLCLLCASLFQQ